VLRDVTDQHQVEEAANQDRARLRWFADVLSHELKSPVNVARGTLERTLTDAQTEIRADLQDVSASLDHIQYVIDDMLAISSGPEYESEQTQVAFSDVAMDVWERVRSGTASADIEPGIMVWAEPSRLDRLLANLFRNAIEHAGASVHVTVGRLENGDGVYIEDDGPGIPESIRDELFHWRGTTKPGGIGIGLPSVKQIVDDEDWAIHVTEAATGGARFELTEMTVE
jgi:signal transduction histidine kinase